MSSMYTFEVTMTVTVIAKTLEDALALLDAQGGYLHRREVVPIGVIGIPVVEDEPAVL